MADPDLFGEEDGMVRMTFGEHLEDLRRRIILALIGFVPGVVIGLSVGSHIVKAMKEPAEAALVKFYQEKNLRDASRLEDARRLGIHIDTKPITLEIDAAEFRKAIDRVKPDLNQSD